MRMSDLVANYINNMIDESNGTAEIQRNELANSLGCVPSQINYVISSRFTQENGYVVESRRGGGGYIRITKIHFVNSIGDSLDATSANMILKNLMAGGVVADETARAMSPAISERAFYSIPKQLRNNVRATVLKNMLLSII